MRGLAKTARTAGAMELFGRSLRLIDRGAVDHAIFLDDRFSLLDAEAAFEAFLDGETCRPVFDVSQLRD